MTRSEELKRLERDQRLDDTSFLRPERHAPVSLDAPVGEHGATLNDFLDDRQRIHLVGNAPRIECPRHGVAHLAERRSRPEWYCRACNAERCADRRRNLGITPRGRPGDCVHGTEHLRKSIRNGKDRWRCRVCESDSQRARRQKKKEAATRATSKHRKEKSF